MAEEEISENFSGLSLSKKTKGRRGI